VTRARLLSFLGLSFAVSVGAFAACTTSKEASPVSPALPSATVEGGSDARVIPDGPRPTCTTVDIAPGTGKKFCDLPGVTPAGMTVPAGFCMREFTTTPLVEARVMRFAPNGDLFIAAPSMATPGGAADGPGSIVVLPDDNGDGRADSIVTFAGPFPRNGMGCGQLEGDPNNLSCVHGLLFSGEYLYYTRSDEVRRIPYTKGQRAASATPSELVATLAGKTISDVRWTHTLEETKDGSIYVSRGRYDSTGCSNEEMSRGAVFAIHPQAKAPLPLNPEVVADGFRNPMYLRCAPNSCGDCYTSELSGDSWDGVGGREKLARLEKKNESWGYPCCVARDRPAPGWSSQSCANVGLELVGIQLHDTPFGLDFERGTFPAPFTHGVFVALHGVVTSYGGTGVVWLDVDPVSLRPTGDSKMFITGFGNLNGLANGRATDVAFAPDGRLFVADDTLGKIYWVAPTTLAAPK
jgi:glucose/arabinose dehydrogenase